MNARVFRTAVSVLAGTLLPVSVGLCATPLHVSGGIAGRVSDVLGVPQMGATVLLYNRFDRLLQRALTTDKGLFGFEALPPDTYAVRVSLSSFLPALKRDIMVQPGTQSLLNVSLASVFSSIELVGVSPGQSSIMSDEWKWVLRSSSATRPVLRLFPELKKPEIKSAAVFSDTRGVVKVSGGDQGGSTELGSEPDLGTAFALATSFMGSNQLHVSGNFGYSSANGAPSAGFRTSFRRGSAEGFSSPEVKLTMRQLALPGRIGPGAVGESPMLRTLSATMLDSKQLTGTVRVEYGMSMDSVAFLDRLNYFSTYSRLTWERVPGETFQIGYASGTPPVEAFMGGHETGLEYMQDLSALALFPRVSLRGGVPRVQRTGTVEVGFSKKQGSRTYAAAVYNDSVNNAAVTMMTDGELPLEGDVLPDLLSNSWTLNAGRYHTTGYTASITQELTPHLDVTLAYGNAGALMADPRSTLDSVVDLRSALRMQRRSSFTTRISGVLPETGTQFIASYQWANIDALNAPHMFLTQRTREGLGLNLRVSQPLPYFPGWPGRLELSAEMRNLLAQGYTPVSLGARRLYLMQVARSVRGGVSFIF